MKKENIKIAVVIAILIVGFMLVVSQEAIKNQTVKILAKGASTSISNVKALQIFFDDTYFRRILMNQAKSVTGWFNLDFLLDKNFLAFKNFI